MAVKSTKSLKTLLRLTKFDLDEKQRVLNECYAREEQIIEAMKAADRQLKQEQQLSAEDPVGVGRLFGAYYQDWQYRRQNHTQQLIVAKVQTQLAQEELAEVFRHMKTLETAKTNREQAATAEENRKEQINLDEIGLNLYRRRKHEEQG